MGSNFGTLYAVNPDGSQRWLFETGSDIRASVAINSDGTVVVASYDGYVRGLDSSTGVEKWHHLLPTSNYASPAITANGTVVACSTGGIVYGNIGGTPPTAIPPTNLTASLASDTQATLNWHDNSSDEYGFRIERAHGVPGNVFHADERWHRNYELHRLRTAVRRDLLLPGLRLPVGRKLGLHE